MTDINVHRVSLLNHFACLMLLLAPLSGGAQSNGETAENDDEELTEIVLPGSIGSAVDSDYYDDLDDAELEDTLPPLSATDRLQDLFKLYRDAVADRMFGEADTLAKQIVELTIEINGLDSGATARAITNLAIAQYGAMDFESAELNFQSAIDITERISDRLNDDLINPLKGLAATQLALGKPREATENYQRATHISHVNFGPHNLEQVETLESLAEAYLVAGDYDEAVDLQERIFTLQSRNISQDSEDLLPALKNQARWLHRLRLFDKERYTWRKMINILQESRGAEDLSLIPPLTGLGHSYLFISYDENYYGAQPSVATGEIYLKRAMRIAENNPEAQWTDVAGTKISLADFYILSGKPARAERLYAEAWDIYSEDESRLAARAEDLQTLPIIRDISLPKVHGVDTLVPPVRRPDGFETGSLIFQYTVTPRGTPTRIELIDAEPAGLEDMERTVVRELRGILHRPRIIDGEATSTDNVRLTHTFYYRSTDVPEEEDETVDAAAQVENSGR